MARRRKNRRRLFGASPEAHERAAEHAYEKSRENAARAAELAQRGSAASCRLATGALATAEYWRGRGDAESSGAEGRSGRGLFHDATKPLSSAYASISLHCWRGK